MAVPSSLPMRSFNGLNRGLTSLLAMLSGTFLCQSLRESDYLFSFVSLSMSAHECIFFESSGIPFSLSLFLSLSRNYGNFIQMVHLAISVDVIKARWNGTKCSPKVSSSLPRRRRRQQWIRREGENELFLPLYCSAAVQDPSGLFRPCIIPGSANFRSWRPRLRPAESSTLPD